MQNLRKKVRDYFSKRFGVRKAFWDEFKFYNKGRSIWIISQNIELRDNFIGSGIRTLRYVGDKMKPTTYILQLLEEEIQKNVKKLNMQEAKHLLLERKELATSLSPGYVALEINDMIIGCGLVNSTYKLKSQISKNRTKELRKALRKTENKNTQNSKEPSLKKS